MSRIRGSDTRPEMLLRRALRASGVGYRLHARDLPGRPDLVFRRSKVAVFVHGCFWHRHQGCRRATTPRSSVDFWTSKFAANVSRDRRSAEALRRLGWTVGVVWECEVEDGECRALTVEAICELTGRRSIKVTEGRDASIGGTASGE